MLLTGESQKALAAYFVCCAGCGLPCVDQTEVCPVCGSTSWGWRNRGLKPIAIKIFWSLALGEILWQGLGMALAPRMLGMVSIVAAVAMVVAPVQHLVGKWVAVESERKTRTAIVAMPILAVLTFLLWMFPGLRGFHTIPGFFAVWTLLSLDTAIGGAKKGPSVVEVATAIDLRRQRLRSDLKRISEEIGKLGTGKGTEVLAGLRGKLEKGKEQVAGEVPVLDRLYEYCNTLRIYLFWRSCLLNVFRGISRIQLADFDAFDAINKELRYAIMDLRLALKRARDQGETEGTEVADYIESFLGIHEIIRDQLTARRAELILAGKDGGGATSDKDGGASQESKAFAEAEYGEAILDRLKVIHARVTTEGPIPR